MGSLAEFSSADSKLPWLWIIEYLASFKEVETSILHDLVEMAPELPEDLAKNTREMVALRCLEDLFGDASGHANDGFPAMEEKIGFALSESCEDVLQHIVQEKSALDLKMAGPELLKWDVHPFIMHKRGSMPKCALQQLKDTILEGTNPLAACLMESSGLMHVNECGKTRTDDVVHNARAWRVNETGTDAQPMATNGNLIPSTCENGNELSQDNLHNTNLLATKRTRNESNDRTTENVVGCFNEIQGEFDLHSNSKRHKQDAVWTDQRLEQVSVPLHQHELFEDIPERVVGVTEGEGCDVSNQSRAADMEDSQFPEDGCDQFVDTKKLGQNGDINDDEIEHDQTVIGYNTDKMSLDTYGDEPVRTVPMDEGNVTEPRILIDPPSLRTQQKDSVDDSKGQAEHFCEDEMLSDNDEYHNERIDVAKEKSHFLGTQCSVDSDSLVANGLTNQNLCVKCKKGGQLLVCNIRSCPLVVHENCLTSAAKFDKKENFCCPFCAYSLAISEYLEAKKKAALARKELSVFMCRGLEQHPKELAERLHRKEHSQEHNTKKQNGQHVHDVSDHLAQESISNREQSEPSASLFHNNLPCREEVANVIGETVCVSNREEVREEAMVKQCVSLRVLEGQQDQRPDNSKSDSDDLTCINTDVASGDQREADVGIQKEDFPQANSNCPEKPVFALNIDGEDTSGEENDKFIISSYRIRFRRREGHYAYPAMPQLRRKKLPWTAEEEKMLKKGVRKFTSVGDRNIPWKKILEFGSSVFLSSRTTIDLKDKWRNMCKGSPTAK